MVGPTLNFQESNMNRLDKLISYVAPAVASKRMAARLAIEQFRSYEAAQKNRRTSHWKTSRGSADAEIEPTLESLRNVSRMMVRNNPYAFNAIDTLTSNVIGSGIRPNIKSSNEKVAAIVKAAWKKFEDSTEADFDGDSTIYGLQEMIARTLFESGECLVIKRKMPSSEKSFLPIRYQVVEPDFIDTEKSYERIEGGGYIKQGIEFNSKGKKVAYWLFPEHPGDRSSYFTTSERFPAKDILHLYRKLRPGQLRGVPVGVASFVRLNDFDDFEQAEIMKQKIASCLVAFVSGGTDSLPGSDTTTGNDKEPRNKLAPGIIEYLDPGKEVTVVNPPTNTGQEQFSRQSQRGSALGYGLTYENFTGDLSNVNFSSYRGGWIEFSRKNQMLQNNLFIPFFQKMFDWFLEALFLKEGIDTSSVTISWTAPRREMIDPGKETVAIIDQILAGLTSWSEAAREFGWNPEDLMKQIVDDQEKFKKLGITVLSDPNNPYSKIGTSLTKAATVSKGVKKP